MEQCNCGRLMVKEVIQPHPTRDYLTLHTFVCRACQARLIVSVPVMIAPAVILPVTHR